MPCYTPITGWRSKDGKNQRGKIPIVFNEKMGEGLPVKIPCGHCIGCKLDRARQWAVRCMHEASLYNFNYFITLTYDNENMDKKCKLDDGVYTINKREFVLFVKRLRKEYGNGIKFFQSAEYGGQTGRPHHHVCFFNLEIDDLKPWKRTSGGTLYTSKSVQEIWGNGYCVIGNVTFESAAYCARYMLKKVSGSNAAEYYQGRESEYSTMSRRPGIGYTYAHKYSQEILASDSIILKGGLKMKPPKAYDKYMDKLNPDRMEEIRAERELNCDRKSHSESQRRIKLHIAEKNQKLFGGRKSC